jgi:hypothetical protein
MVDKALVNQTVAAAAAAAAVALVVVVLVPAAAAAAPATAAERINRPYVRERTVCKSWCPTEPWA